MKPIEIRAHHLLCIPRFYSGGYDENFAKNMKETIQIIRENPNTKIKVLVGELDNLCHECPHKFNGGCVQSKKIGKWVVAQDEKVAEFLNIKHNSIHKAKNIFKLGMDNVNKDNMKSICKGCIFLDNCIKVGVNNSFKKDLEKER